MVEKSLPAVMVVSVTTVAVQKGATLGERQMEIYPSQPDEE